MHKLPWYEYLITIFWVGIIAVSGFTSLTTNNQTVAYCLFSCLVIFSAILIWLRRTEWRNQAWQGLVKSKQRRRAGLLPLFKPPYEIIITQTNVDLPVRVRRTIYQEVQIGELVRKDSGDNNVYIG